MDQKSTKNQSSSKEINRNQRRSEETNIERKSKQIKRGSKETIMTHANPQATAWQTRKHTRKKNQHSHIINIQKINETLSVVLLKILKLKNDIILLTYLTSFILVSIDMHALEYNSHLAK